MSIDPTVNIMLNSLSGASTSNRRATYKKYDGDDIEFPNVTLEPLAWGQAMNGFSSHVAVVNNDDNRVITVVTDSYELLPHEQFIDIADKAMKDKYGNNASRHTYMINGGDKMLVTYCLEDNPIKLRSGDIAYPTLVLKNSYDLGWAASMTSGVFRLICSNGAYVGEMTKTKKKHTAQIDGDLVKNVITQMVGNISSIEQRMTQWASTKISKKDNINLDPLKLSETEQQTIRYLGEKSTGLHIDSKVIETADGEKTVWRAQDDTTKYDLWNLLTEFATHRIASPVRRDMVSTNIDKLFHSPKLITA